MKTIQHIIIAATFIGGVAHADDDAAAAFKRGKTALKANKIHDACMAFDESEKAKAAVETEVALASCLEQDGQLVAAAKMYRTAADKDADAKRKKTSSEKATKLEARAPKLRFAIAPTRPDGLSIKVDGVDVPSTGDVMVDLGPHEVTATAPGYEGHANAPVDREGQILDVILRMEATAPAPAPEPAPMPKVEDKPAPAPSPEPAAPAAEPASPQPMMVTDAHPSHGRRNAVIIGSVGVAAVIAGVVFGELGTSKFNDEHDLCPGHLCATDADTAKANSLKDDGRTYRQIGIGVGIGGAVLVGVGAVLFATAHHESSSPVAVQLDKQGASATYTVRF